jgi:hypothetical protein
MTESAGWRLADDLAHGLATEVPGAAGRPLLEDLGRGAEGGHFIATGPTDDRSKWHLKTIQEADRKGDWLRFSHATISSARKSLTLVLTILHAEDSGSMGWRWRLATRIVEISYPLVVERASGGDAESARLLPLHTWVRWRMLSEPFREVDVDTSSTNLQQGATPTTRLGDPNGPHAFARGTFSGWHSLRRKARESRSVWAETLLQFQDLPTLGAIDTEPEGRLLVFADDNASHLIKIDDRSSGHHPPDATFITWFSREFFSRRFMVSEMWKAVASKWKRLTVAAVVLTAVLSLVVAWLIAPESSLLDIDTSGDYWRIAIAIAFLLALIATVGSLVAGIIWTRDGERYAYPFLLRFGAVAMLGSAAVVTMRAGWIQNLSNPGDGNRWRPWILIAGLVAAGFVYLLVEARLHGVSPSATLRRASTVWLIGLMWALAIAAIDILAIAPVFTEDYFVFSESDTRFWGFAITALASLDLGIFLQVLWEDRPVTYPLGALRFSKHE